MNFLIKWLKTVLGLTNGDSVICLWALFCAGTFGPRTGPGGLAGPAQPVFLALTILHITPHPKASTEDDRVAPALAENGLFPKTSQPISEQSLGKLLLEPRPPDRLMNTFLTFPEKSHSWEIDFIVSIWEKYYDMSSFLDPVKIVPFLLVWNPGLWM